MVVCGAQRQVVEMAACSHEVLDRFRKPRDWLGPFPFWLADRKCHDGAGVRAAGGYCFVAGVVGPQGPAFRVVRSQCHRRGRVGAVHVDDDILGGLRFDAEFAQEAEVAGPVDETVWLGAVGDEAVVGEATGRGWVAGVERIAGMAAAGIDVRFDVREGRRVAAVHGFSHLTNHSRAASIESGFTLWPVLGWTRSTNFSSAPAAR